MDRAPGLAPARRAAIRRRAERRFWSGPARLFVCQGAHCAERSEGSGSLASGRRLAISETGCQGACEVGPVATLRVGERCQSFAGLRSAAAWSALRELAGRAASAGTLLVDPGRAGPLRYDPVHGGLAGTDPLAGLAFLVGRFHGAGRLGPGHWFHKELVGERVAGGRFLSLRMAVSHELGDGSKDVHEALVLIGRAPGTGRLEARAFTDGGDTAVFELEEIDQGIAFDDPVRVHGEPPRPACKRIERCEEGVLEEVDLRDAAPGESPYSSVRLRRVSSRAGARLTSRGGTPRIRDRGPGGA